MRKYKNMLVAITAGAGLLLGSSLSAAPQRPNQVAAPAVFTHQQQQAMGQFIQQYMLKHPELLMQMAQELRQRQMQHMQAAADKAQAVIIKHHNQLVNDPRAVVEGSSKAPITLVEFYDYQCSACAATYPELTKFMQTPFAKKNVRVVYRAFPFFGAASVYAAKMVIAAETQHKAIALHNAMFDSGLIEGKLTKNAVDRIATLVDGLNVKKLKQQMKQPWVQQEVATNAAMVKAINLRATPAFVFIPTRKSQTHRKNTKFINSGLSATQFTSIAKMIDKSLKS